MIRPSLNYLAYGSNLHPHRLSMRGVRPRLIGIVELPNRALTFHKRGKDASGKGTFHEHVGGQFFGAVYEILPAEKAVLDRIEGLGHGYEEMQIQVTLSGERCRAMTYVASTSHLDSSLRPYHWYKSMVALGCEYHRFPQQYISAISAAVSVQDPDASRRRSNEELLETMRAMIG